ncbi:MAG TPA: LytTR family DNA-binding domain-containing protein [Blastocatellia bacterium]|nr:LytTR family DNA-binding domain-containing protein [Blastocatellia bacterium]
MNNANSRKIKAIIVDDEPPARRNLRALLKGVPDIELVKECGNGRDAVSCIRSLQPDLVFLDVQMPELDGFEALENLAGHPLPIIIFVTAYDQYALKAFEVSALDYLLKPFDDARFHKALAQARRQIEQQDASELGRKLLTLLGAREVKADAPPRYLTRLMVKTAGRVIFIRAEEIDWIEAYDNYIRLHVGGKAHLLRQTMNELEAALNPEQFARIHRSTIVNLDCVKELRAHFNGEHLVILQDGTELKLSRSRKEWLEQRLGAGAGY